MLYEAFSTLKQKLLDLPESGMGYQIIDAIPENKYVSSRYIVYNSELIIDLDSQFKEYRNQIIKEGYSRIKSKANLLGFKQFSLVLKSSVTEVRYLSESLEKDKGRYRGGKGAKDNPKEYPDGKEIFVRLSAYENDFRIDFENKKLKKGSYTTTLADYFTCKKYADDPVDRYALPNDEEIKWAFHIQPKSYDSLQRGIVQPAFGHDGGGIETYFENGTSSGTFIKKTEY